MSILISPIHSHLSYPFGFHTFVLYVCLYFCLANQFIYTIFLESTPYALIDIYFNIFDLLHSIWQSLGPSMSLQKAQFPSLLWLKVKVTQLCLTLCDPCLWNSPGQNTGEGSHSILQGIFPTQGSNPGLTHCRWIPYQLSHEGSLLWLSKKLA